MGLFTKASKAPEPEAPSEQKPSDPSKEPSELSKDANALSDEELGSVAGGFASVIGIAPTTTIKTTL